MLGGIKRLMGFEAKGFDPFAALFLAAPTAAGEPVTPETAMRCTPVYSSVKVLSESVAQLPLHLYQRGENGAKDRAKDHPLYELLRNGPNDWTTATEFQASMQTALCLHGNAYAYINRAADGTIAELIQIPSADVSVDADPRTMEPLYRVTDASGGQRVYDRSEILHLKTIGSRPLIGDSPIMLAREAIGLALAMEKHGASLFGKGARPSGILEYSKPLGKDTAARLRESWNAAHGGGHNSGGTALLEDGMTFKPVQFSSVDLQFLEMRRFQIAEIARVFRIPLHMVGDLERTTHNNAEHMGRQFLTFTLLPWLKIWEQGVNRLIEPEQRKIYFAEFLTDDLARADIGARYEAYAKAVTNGLLSPNEIRAAENRPPYAGGDAFRLPLNTEDAASANTRP